VAAEVIKKATVDQVTNGHRKPITSNSMGN